MASKLNYSAYLFNTGAVVIGLLGCVHGYLTISGGLDPSNGTTIEIMKNEATNLTKDANGNLYKAYLGFNYTHSLGAIIFSTYSLYLYNKTDLFKDKQSKSILYGSTIGIAMSYLAISSKYFFIAPTRGIGLAALCFIGSYVMS